MTNQPLKHRQLSIINSSKIAINKNSGKGIYDMTINKNGLFQLLGITLFVQALAPLLGDEGKDKINSR